MRQELVFIGQNLDQNRIKQALDDCLLTEDQMLKGRQFWETLVDPSQLGRKRHECSYGCARPH